jgi:hypothetical protein
MATTSDPGVGQKGVALNDYENTLQSWINYRTTTDHYIEPGMAIFLSIITCGIYGFYVYYRMMQRRDEHFKRMAAVADTSLGWLRTKAQGREQAIQGELTELDALKQWMVMQSAERGAAIWLLILIFTSCIGYFIFFYLLMKDYKEHDAYESRFFTIMSSALTKLGMSQQAGQAALNIPQRDFGKYVLFSIITCGIFSFYWLYVMVDDLNKHFALQVQWEDYLLTSLRG